MWNPKNYSHPIKGEGKCSKCSSIQVVDTETIHEIGPEVQISF